MQVFTCNWSAENSWFLVCSMYMHMYAYVENPRETLYLCRLCGENTSVSLSLNKLLSLFQLEMVAC